MASTTTERSRTHLRLVTLEDAVDIIKPDPNGLGVADALALLGQCGDNVEATVTRIMSEHEYVAVRRYLVRRGLMSLLDAELRSITA
ncbi:hypothetical protein GPL21_17375 [Bradyrhizobium pachyrhizi]|uniref:Uncharacterized protein n=1 Tax=Bradyrhizobium pachyrhizi TaxID=280333 RepID=A0A844SI56_9BRAD|nr:hypothetical protein [Bradyrhizobium pachyrhizi]MVT66873.1 hypothetical protein [Bradyrhizobium pachyrhizi]